VPENDDTNCENPTNGDTICENGAIGLSEFPEIRDKDCLNLRQSMLESTEFSASIP